MEHKEAYEDFRKQVIRYLSGEMHPDEEKQFLAEKDADKEKMRLFEEYQKIWQGVDAAGTFRGYDLDSEWDLLAEKLDFEEKKASFSLGKSLLRIAAVLIIGLIGVGVWQVLRTTKSYEETAYAVEGVRTIVLPDNSKVILYEGSELQYFAKNEQDRNVKLTGEAFFEVKKDTSRPFIVEAGSATVEVLGTSFNVKALKKTRVVEVTVKTGMVSLSSGEHASRAIILNPGNSGVYHRGRRNLELIPKADPNNLAWVTREIVFEDTPLREVVKVLGHAYTTHLELADPILEDCPITVTFNNQDLAAVLNVLTSTLDLEVKRSESGFVLSGEGCN